MYPESLEQAYEVVCAMVRDATSEQLTVLDYLLNSGPYFLNEAFEYALDGTEDNFYYTHGNGD